MNWRPPLRGCHAPTRPRHSGWPDASFPAWPPWTPRPGSAVTEGATADLEDNLPSRDCPLTPRAAVSQGRRSMRAIARALDGRVHYAWVVVGVTFVLLLTAAGVRATPSVLIVPLEQAFGWSRATISAAVAVNIFLYGLMGPFAAALMQSMGVRRTIIASLALLVLAVGGTTLMAAPWQLVLLWGLLVGVGVGAIAMVLGATIVSRWFVTNRGLVMGILAASTASGQLVFLPLLAWLASTIGWRAVTITVAVAVALLVPLVLFLLPERPQAVGLRAYGATGSDPDTGPAANPVARAFAVLGRCGRSGDFWLL